MLNRKDLEVVIRIAKAAGSKILEVYNSDIEVETKDDDSPLTLADKLSNEVIVAGLEKHFPDIPILSEESTNASFEERQGWEYFWCVDPLDGTKEFIKKNDEFTVNIALVHYQIPIIGVIYVPVTGVMYYSTRGEGCFKREKNGSEHQMRIMPYSGQGPFRIVASRSHINDETKEFITVLEEEYGEVHVLSAGSSLKFCLIAEGRAHIYPRFGPTMEWDTAAGHAIAEEAGARVVQDNDDEDPLIYNKENLLNPFFIVDTE